MCGIIGFNWKDEILLNKQTNLIRYRGPDDHGYLIDDNVSLGHRRLSIIDLSKNGHQPMSYLDYTIVFNGEIYNYKNIKTELEKDYVFRTNSDTEVIIYAYDKWGEDCLERFNGMFAFCIYDKKKKELFLARDRFGKKPLYYINKAKKFVFSSEIKQLYPFLDKKEVDDEGLRQFFSFRFTLEDKTLVKSVSKFLPGHHMTYDLNKCKVKSYKRYYEIKKQKILRYPQNKLIEKLKGLIDDSVKLRMTADVPVACLLSGGIDSSIIAMLAKRYNKNLNTFSIGFDTTNELPYAKVVSKFLKTKHHEIKIDKDSVLKYLDNMVFHMDEPIGDPGFLPIFVLSEEVKKHNKVVLSGDGGDEVFCGYDRYKLYLYGKKIGKFIPHHFGNDILKRLKKMQGRDEYKAFFEVIRLFDDEELKKLKIKRFDAKKMWKIKHEDMLLNAQEFDINTLLPNDFFMKADKMSSAFGLEQRVPFLDPKLVEFAFSLPLKQRLRFWNEKHLLKKAYKKDLPKEIIRRRKHGFDVPIDYWFKNVLGQKLKDLLKRNNHSLYDKRYVYKLLEDIKKKGKSYKLNFILAQKLWSILMLEMWHERFIR